MPKFEGVLEVNSNLTKTKRLFEGQLIGPESIAVDSTGNQGKEFLYHTIVLVGIINIMSGPCPPPLPSPQGGSSEIEILRFPMGGAH